MSKVEKDVWKGSHIYLHFCECTSIIHHHTANWGFRVYIYIYMKVICHGCISLIAVTCSGWINLKWLQFPTTQLSPRRWKHAINTRWLANPSSRCRQHFPRYSWSSYEHLVHHQRDKTLLSRWVVFSYMHSKFSPKHLNSCTRSLCAWMYCWVHEHNSQAEWCFVRFSWTLNGCIGHPQLYMATYEPS